MSVGEEDASAQQVLAIDKQQVLTIDNLSIL
jgi:hypothetical protein